MSVYPVTQFLMFKNPLLCCRDIHTRMGDHSLRANEGSEQCITSAQKFPHPDYNPTTHDSDIMLIRLRNPANINEYVRPIALATECAAPNTPCLVSGWGTVETPKCTVMFSKYIQWMRRGEQGLPLTVANKTNGCNQPLLSLSFRFQVPPIILFPFYFLALISSLPFTQIPKCH